MKPLATLFAAVLALPAVFPAQTPEPLPAMQKITPFLWFDADAEQAMRFYVTVFPDSKILSESRWGPGGPVPAGTLMSARIQLAGQELMLLNGGPRHQLSEAFSLFVSCETQAEVDRLWTTLGADGKPDQCGWLKDRFGLSWQIIPQQLLELLGDKDPARAGRAAQAMMSMGKIDIAKLQAAADGR
jgi:predicted 3-demethylubiquinone-9 3-methyltransferase (glyoxalase superfamily)